MYGSRNTATLGFNMAVRTFEVRAESKGRMRVKLSAQIITEPGTLTRHEIEKLKADLADKLLFALNDVPYLHVNISQMKVTR